MIFNPVRSLRPARASAEKIEVINRAFNDQLFNFNKPFLAPEVFWEGEWEDVQSAPEGIHRCGTARLPGKGEGVFPS